MVTLTLISKLTEKNCSKSVSLPKMASVGVYLSLGESKKVLVTKQKTYKIIKASIKHSLLWRKSYFTEEVEIVFLPIYTTLFLFDCLPSGRGIPINLCFEIWTWNYCTISTLTLCNILNFTQEAIFQWLRHFSSTSTSRHKNDSFCCSFPKQKNYVT